MNTVLCNLLIICSCFVLICWSILGIEILVSDFKRNDREKVRAQRDLEYHLKRMENLE